MDPVMDDKTRESLEMDAVLEHLAGSAQSALGSAAVRALEPATEYAEVERRLAVAGEALHLLDTGGGLPLSGLEDVRELLDRAEVRGGALGPEDWPRLRRFLGVAGETARYLKHAAGTSPNLSRAGGGLETHEDIGARIDRLFDEDGQVRDDASPELRRLRNERRKHEAAMRRTIQKLLDRHRGGTVLQDEFTTIRNGRHVFPVRAGSRGKLQGIVHGASATGETIYIEPGEIVESANEIELIRQGELQEIHRLLIELTELVRPSIPALRENLAILGELDGIQALARHAASHGWKIPVVAETGAMKLYDTHHPLLQMRQRANSVPVTMALESGDRMILLSGPNAGGKTTAMKTIALVAALVQCGSPVPVSPDSRLPVFTEFHADIGDQQDLDEGLSTFTGHVRRLRHVMATASRRALVILDELGTGTDPEEGGALAQAMLETLLERAALTIATSHLGPLKKWAEETPGARNASFSLDPHTHRPTFRLRIGLPGASEALVIAENEGLPRGVLERARSLVGEQKAMMGELLRRIEERERALAESLRETEARAKGLEQQEAIARRRAEELRAERRHIRETALEQREQVVRGARERIEKLIASLPGEEELRQRKEALNRAREAALREQRGVAEERALIEHEDKEGPAGHRGLGPGKRVWVRAMNDWGEVEYLEPDRGKARVHVGAMTVDVPIEGLFKKKPELELPPEPVEFAAEPEEPETKGKKKKKKRSKRVKAALQEMEKMGESARIEPPPRVFFKGGSVKAPREPLSLELDLHGYRVDEAIEAIDRYLDRALMADVPHVRLVHGTGQGRLYRAVHEHLRTLPFVGRFRFATPDEGGGGCTIVEFKE